MTVTPFRIGWLILSACLYALLAYNTTREQFGMLLGLLFLLFWGYSLRIQPFHRSTHPHEPTPETDRFLFGSAILFRLLLLLAPPQLSDDYYRFIWDGRLLANGFNPYLYLPSAIVNSIPGINEALFQQLNSPDYYTVYPPLNQAMFGLAAWLSPDNLAGNIVGLRIPILLAEIGSLWLLNKLLKRVGKDPNLALLYGLNPLVILELTGNLHYEAVVLFFGLLAIWLLLENRWVLSAGALALAVSTKLVPLIFLPLLIRWLGWYKGALYSIITIALTALLFLPFASLELVQNIFSSINLYFQKFEFNASVYYLIRELGYWLQGYNIIAQAGPFLSLITLAGILWLSWGKGSEHKSLKIRAWELPAIGVNWGDRVLWILMLYFALATTVHPWYITTLVGASVFSHFRFPLVWSATVLLSYATYQTIPYHENLWFTAFEYSVVAVFAWREIA